MKRLGRKASRSSNKGGAGLAVRNELAAVLGRRKG